MVEQAFRRMAGQAEKSLSKVDKAMGRVNKEAGSLQNAMRLIVAGAVARQIVQTIAEYENLEAQLVTITGSADKAKIAFAGIADIAAKTPFSVQEVTESFIKLGAQGIAPTRERIIAFGDAAASMGQSITRFADAVLRAATGEFENLKTFGIVAKTVGDKVAFTFKGQTTLVKKNAQEIVNYLQTLAETNFAGAMERQSKTLGGAWSNLKDQASLLMKQIGEGGLSSALRDATKELTTAGESSERSARSFGFFVSTIVDAVRIGARALAGFAGIAFSVGVGVVAALNKMTLEFYKKMSELAGAFGLEEASAKYAKFAGEIQRDLNFQTDLLKGAFDFTVDSIGGIGDVYKDFITRLADFSPVAQRVAGDMNGIANGLENVSEKADGAGKALKARIPQLLPTERDLDTASNAMQHMGELLNQFGIHETQKWNDELKFVRENWQKLGLTEAEALVLMKKISAETATVKAGADEVADAWGSFVDQSLRTLVDNIQSAFADTLYNLFNSGKLTLGELWKAVLQSFLRMAAEMVSQWLVTEKLKTAITLKEAAKRKAADGGSSSGTGTGGNGWLGSIAKLFKGGSGGGAASVSWAGVFAFAAIAAYGVWRKHQRDQERQKRYDFGFSYAGTGTGVANSTRQGAQDALAAMQGLYNDLANVLQSGQKGLAAARINIRNDHKLFEVWVGQEMLGRFKTMEEAILRAAGTAFAGVTSDPALQQLLRGAGRFGSPEELTAAVETVKNLTDLANGISETGSSIRSILPSLEQLGQQLRQWGLDAAQVTRLVAAQGIKSFTDAWRGISGEQESPQEQRARKEAERQILLAEMKLEAARLQARKQQLLAALAIARGEVTLEREVIDTRTAFIRGEDELWRVEGKMFGRYLQGRGEMVGLNADILQAELDAISQYLGALGTLIDKVTIGKINIGGAGGGRGRGGLGGALDSERKQFLDAWKDALKALREWWQGLNLSQFSPLTPQQRLAEAQAQVRAAVEAIHGGGQAGLTALQNLPQLLETLLGAGSDVLGTSTGGYQALFQQVQQLVAGLLGEDLPVEIRRRIENVLFGGGGGPAFGDGGGAGGGAGRMRLELGPVTDRLDALNLTATKQLVELRKIAANTAGGGANAALRRAAGNS